MLWLYNIAIQFYGLLVRCYSLFNRKAKLFVEGRKDVFDQISVRLEPDKKHIWFHFASLGEFEQGRTVIEQIKLDRPDKKIVVTFFSPSGYEIRKNYPLAAGVFYLPLDTPNNARKLIDAFNPELAVFTKYEFWYHYYNALQSRKIPIILISSIFRPDQVFFKWYGKFNRSILKCVHHFFVQNLESIDLLKTIGINKVTLSGDTRFDRVFETAVSAKPLKEIEQFLNGSPALVAGSTWPSDEHHLKKLIDKHPNWKFIIAPHEIDESRISNLIKLIPSSSKYSELNGINANQTLIIDNIGMLSSLYQYARIAYIGGGFGAGIHNTLEAAAFGIPIIFGPNYNKFQEAKDLLHVGAARSINNEDELLEAFNDFSKSDTPGMQAQAYVLSKRGATAQIINYIGKIV